MNDQIHIFLPVHNRAEITSRFIECLKAQTHTVYHLVLIDDGSTDGTEEMVREQVESVTVLKGTGDWWWGGSLHQGFKWLARSGVDGEDAVLIMNDDTEFQPDFLEKGLSILRERPETLLLAMCFSLSSGELLDAGVHADWRRFRFSNAERPEDVNCLSTMGLFLRVKDFLAIGGFHPRLLPHFISDYEFTMRAFRKGFALATDTSVKLWLREETTWNRDIGQEPFFSFVRLFFSKKSAYNPITWTFFVALACPPEWRIQNWLNIWKGVVYVLLRRLYGPINLPGSTHTARKEEEL